jgi:glycosyltransferase involved in cell wall biosynthesis
LAELAGRDVSFVYPPVRTSFFTPLPSSREHFLAVSRLFSHKRIDIILDAFRTLPDERLVVAGAGPALSALRAAAPPNVTFAGSVGDAELLELYRSSRALVTASVEEFGLSTAEALATGMPVVGPRAGGTGEIVDDGQTGVLFDRVDSGSVGAAIRHAMECEFDPATCRRSAERFSEDRFVAELEPILRRQTVSPSRPRPPASPPPALRSRA